MYSDFAFWLIKQEPEIQVITMISMFMILTVSLFLNAVTEE